MLDDLDYFRSITLEFQALKDRVQHFIGHNHWQTVGEWKGSVLRAVLRRHLPQTVAVGKGFVITQDGPSCQIDVLLYDRTKPILYQEGDLAIITPDLCLGLIEVKTRLDATDLRNAIRKLADCRHHVSRTAQCRPFTGLFSFEHDGEEVQPVLNHLKAAGEGLTRRVVNCVSLGPSLFTRYWDCAPENPQRQAYIFRAYHLMNMAPAYFVHNVLEALCAESVLTNNDIWYPKDGKERSTRGQISLKD